MTFVSFSSWYLEKVINVESKDKQFRTKIQELLVSDQDMFTRVYSYHEQKMRVISEPCLQRTKFIMNALYLVSTITLLKNMTTKKIILRENVLASFGWKAHFNVAFKYFIIWFFLQINWMHFEIWMYENVLRDKTKGSDKRDR